MSNERTKIKAILLLFFWIAAGCTNHLLVDDLGEGNPDNLDGGGDSDIDTVTDSDTGRNTDTDSNTDSNTDNSTDTDTGPDAGGNPDGETVTECTEGIRIGSEPLAADVILVVDNSAKMEQEIEMVKQQLGIFVQQLTSMGLDPQITLITAPFPSADKKEKNGICMDAPLGSGACPDDTNLPVYAHIPQVVGSKDTLSLINSTFDLWKDRIRSDSIVHFFVVSDDDAADTPESFVAWMEALTPPLQTFRFHALVPFEDNVVACEQDPPGACCEVSAHKGTVYQSLADITGGATIDLCIQDFSKAFADVADTIRVHGCSPGRS